VNDYDFRSLMSSSRQMFVKGASVDQVLKHLRELGASPVASMKVLHDVLGISVTEAKESVLASDAWADQKPEFDRSNAIVEEVLRLTDTNHEDRG
jgi:hypothetical protein